MSSNQAGSVLKICSLWLENMMHLICLVSVLPEASALEILKAMQSKSSMPSIYTPRSGHASAGHFFDLSSWFELFCFKIRLGTATSRLFSRCSETQKQLKGHLLMFCYPSKKATMHAVCLALSVGLSSKESTPWKMLRFKNARKKGSILPLGSPRNKTHVAISS